MRDLSCIELPRNVLISRHSISARTDGWICLFSIATVLYVTSILHYIRKERRIVSCREDMSLILAEPLEGPSHHLEIRAEALNEKGPRPKGPQARLRLESRSSSREHTSDQQ